MVLSLKPAESVGSRTPGLCSIAFVQRQHLGTDYCTYPGEEELLRFPPLAAPVRRDILDELPFEKTK